MMDQAKKAGNEAVEMSEEVEFLRKLKNLIPPSFRGPLINLIRDSRDGAESCRPQTAPFKTRQAKTSYSRPQSANGMIPWHRRATSGGQDDFRKSAGSSKVSSPRRPVPAFSENPTVEEKAIASFDNKTSAVQRSDPGARDESKTPGAVSPRAASPIDQPTNAAAMVDSDDVAVQYKQLSKQMPMQQPVAEQVPVISQDNAVPQETLLTLLIDQRDNATLLDEQTQLADATTPSLTFTSDIVTAEAPTEPSSFAHKESVYEEEEVDLIEEAKREAGVPVRSESSSLWPESTTAPETAAPTEASATEVLGLAHETPPGISPDDADAQEETGVFGQPQARPASPLARRFVSEDRRFSEDRKFNSSPRTQSPERIYQADRT